MPRPARPQATGTTEVELPQRLDLRLPPGGASAEDSAALTRAILGGEQDGAASVAVVLGAALRILAAGACDTVEAGVQRARAAISSGTASARLDRMLDTC